MCLCQQGKVPEDFDTTVVGTPLRCHVIPGCADVGQGVHLGGEKIYLHEARGNLRVIDYHVPHGFGVQDYSGLRLRGKLGAPD